MLQDLDHCRYINGVSVDGCRPGAIDRCFNCLETLPDSAVTLKPAAEAYHPNTIALHHTPLGLNVVELVPE